MRRPVYRGRIVDLGLETVQLPNGHEVELEVIRHPGASAIVPVHADGTVTLVHQYRHAGGGMHIEVPAGVLDEGESPETCAHRELAEEVQLRAGQLVSLGTIYTTPGFTDEQIHLFLGRELSVAEGQPEPDEYIEVLRVPLVQALGWVESGRITDGKTICALFMARRRLIQGG
ncbi:MAG: NUDIX hydrolase [Myxococcota bacterium]|jgi:ADP-ribose pyrophosphatase|nr:NUDIX hydrolase [Myxococcota bacterium]